MTDDTIKARQATPSEDLEYAIINPCVPKNEREWWAAREIERLRSDLAEMKRQRDEAYEDAAYAAAEAIMAVDDLSPLEMIAEDAREAIRALKEKP